MSYDKYRDAMFGAKDDAPHHTDPEKLDAFVKAMRGLQGFQRADIAARLPWDVAAEIIDLAAAAATPICDPKHLDHDEDYRRWLRTWI